MTPICQLGHGAGAVGGIASHLNVLVGLCHKQVADLTFRPARATSDKGALKAHHFQLGLRGLQLRVDSFYHLDRHDLPLSYQGPHRAYPLNAAARSWRANGAAGSCL